MIHKTIRCLSIVWLLFAAFSIWAKDISVQLVGTNTEDDILQYTDVFESIDFALRTVITENGFVLLEEDNAALRIQYNAHVVLPRIHLSLFAVDTNKNVHLAGVTTKVRFNITLLDSIRDAFTQILPVVREYFSLSEENIKALSPDGFSLTSASQLTGAPEDTQIKLLTDGDEEFDITGSLDYLLIEGEKVKYRVQRKGYHAVTDSIAVYPDLVFQIPELMKHRRIGLQVHYSYQRLIGGGVGVRYYILPEKIYGMAEFDFHSSNISGVTAPLHVEGRILGGYQVFNFPFGLSLGVNSGLGYVFTNVRGLLPFHDMYWNVINASIEYRLNQFKFFVRTGMVYAFNMDRGLLFNARNINPNISAGVMMLW